MANIILTKESSDVQIKRYFEAVLKLSQTDNEFPINLDDVWMMVYSQKAKATAALQDAFIEGIDFYLSQNGKVIKSSEIQNGVKVDYYLSIPCLEYFIARKVRPVFEVYRKVFHKVITGRKEVIYTEKEVKKHLLDAEKQVRDAVKTVNELHLQNAELQSKVRTLTALLEEEVITRINTLVFIEGKNLTKELKAYLA